MLSPRVVAVITLQQDKQLLRLVLHAKNYPSYPLTMSQQEPEKKHSSSRQPEEGVSRLVRNPSTDPEPLIRKCVNLRIMEELHKQQQQPITMSDEKEYEWAITVTPSKLPLVATPEFVRNFKVVASPFVDKQGQHFFTIEQLREIESMIASLIKPHGVPADDDPPCGESCGS